MASGKKIGEYSLKSVTSTLLRDQEVAFSTK